MDNKKSFWGGKLGLVTALCLVVAFVCGTVALCLSLEKNRDVLLDTDEVIKVSADVKVENGTNVVSLTFRLEKAGYFFTDYKTEEKGGNLVVRLYGSVTKKDYSPDSTGAYTIKLPVDTDMDFIMQEGKENEAKLVDIH